MKCLHFSHMTPISFNGRNASSWRRRIISECVGTSWSLPIGGLAASLGVGLTPLGMSWAGTPRFPWVLSTQRARLAHLSPSGTGRAGICWAIWKPHVSVVLTAFSPQFQSISVTLEHIPLWLDFNDKFWMFLCMCSLWRLCVSPLGAWGQVEGAHCMLPPLSPCWCRCLYPAESD